MSCVQSLRAEKDPAPLELGRITVGGFTGDDHQEYILDAMVPIWKKGDSMLLLQPRGTLRSDDEQALSGGFVARRLLPAHEVILGMNLFYDQSWTEGGNTFGQVGGGLEVLSKWVDARGNYYYPVTDDKPLSERESGALALTRTYREALQGYDTEVGVWLPYLSRVAPTALFAGYYDFSGDIGKEDVDGIKLRAELRPHPNITLDAEWFEHSEDGKSEYLVGVRLNLPLDFHRGVRLDRRGSAGARVRDFSTRMLDPVQRSFQVMTRETDVTSISVAPQVSGGDQSDECIQYADLDSEGNVVIITICP